jgi:hypothetical protein
MSLSSSPAQIIELLMIAPMDKVSEISTKEFLRKAGIEEQTTGRINLEDPMVESRHQNPLRLSLQNAPEPLFIFLQPAPLLLCLMPTSPVPSRRQYKEKNQGGDQQEIDEADNPDQMYVTIMHRCDSRHTPPSNQTGCQSLESVMCRIGSLCENLSQCSPPDRDLRQPAFPGPTLSEHDRNRSFTRTTSQV